MAWALGENKFPQVCVTATAGDNYSRKRVKEFKFPLAEQETSPFLAKTRARFPLSMSEACIGGQD